MIFNAEDAEDAERDQAGIAPTYVIPVLDTHAHEGKRPHRRRKPYP
jgi:hypothetical protein